MPSKLFKKLSKSKFCVMDMCLPVVVAIAVVLLIIYRAEVQSFLSCGGSESFTKGNKGKSVRARVVKEDDHVNERSYGEKFGFNKVATSGNSSTKNGNSRSYGEGFGFNKGATSGERSTTQKLSDFAKSIMK